MRSRRLLPAAVVVVVSEFVPQQRIKQVVVDVNGRPETRQVTETVLVPVWVKKELSLDGMTLVTGGGKKLTPADAMARLKKASVVVLGFRNLADKKFAGVFAADTVLLLSPPAPVVPMGAETVSLKEIARQAALRAEREAISAMLARTNWNKRKAAMRLQISYKALLYKIKDCGLTEPRIDLRAFFADPDAYEGNLPARLSSALIASPRNHGPFAASSNWSHSFLRCSLIAVRSASSPASPAHFFGSSPYVNVG